MNRYNMNKADSDIDFMKIVTGRKITSNSNPMDEIKVISFGVMPSDATQFREILGWNVTLFGEASGISVRTIQRHQKSNKPFGLSTSQTILELARLSLISVSYFGSVNRWNNWLMTPHIQFNNDKPFSVINTIRGREIIKRIVCGLGQGFAT